MLQSMTAFGRGEVEAGGYHFTVELRSVNHRFCDIQVKLPRKYQLFEEDIRKRLSSRFSRGRLEVSVLVDESLEKVQQLQVDTELARTYARLLRELQEQLGLQQDLKIEAFLGFRDIFVFRQDEESQKEAWEVLERALELAAGECQQMRTEEGAAIENDFVGRLQHLEGLTAEVEARAPFVVQDAHDRLRLRVQELLVEMELDEARLAQEIAFLAERCDVTEEVVRLKSHIQQFRDLLGEEGPRGRQLEFLLQEMHREINTIGSKANDLVIAQKVVQVKTELERLREQVQNVE